MMMRLCAQLIIYIISRLLVKVQREVKHTNTMTPNAG